MEQKISISMGCIDWLVREVETLRRQNELLSSETRVMNNFFSMVERLNGPRSVGYGEDRLWQAKKEIEQAKNDVVQKDE